MFKNRILIALGVLSMLLLTMGVSQPFSETSVANVEGANDFYQRHRDWNRNLEGTDYFERHTDLMAPVATIDDLTGDFALRHTEWTVGIPNAAIPLTGILEASDYFQRHPELSLPEPSTSAVDLSDYFNRHPELPSPATIDLSDYFQRH